MGTGTTEAAERLEGPDRSICTARIREAVKLLTNPSSTPDPYSRPDSDPNPAGSLAVRRPYPKIIDWRAISLRFHYGRMLGEVLFPYHSMQPQVKMSV